MDISSHIKKFSLPSSFAAPTHLQHASLIAVPLNRLHVLEDPAAVNSSGATIRATVGGRWPEEELTEDFNFLDLAWHEREFRVRRSFAYAVHEGGEYVGCFYLNPLGSRVPLSEELLEKYDTEAYWWVTAAAYERGLYEVLLKR